jgi:hypothetical protein
MFQRQKQTYSVHFRTAAAIQIARVFRIYASDDRHTDCYLARDVSALTRGTWKLAQEVPVMQLQIASKDELIQRVRSEYLEMPGLQLSVPQACRLWGLDADTCGTVMDQLVQSKFLYRTRAGGFARPQ